MNSGIRQEQKKLVQENPDPKGLTVPWEENKAATVAGISMRNKGGRRVRYLSNTLNQQTASARSV